MSIIQTSFALEHEFSDEHINHCEQSLCINPLLLDNITEPNMLSSIQLAFPTESSLFVLQLVLIPNSKKRCNHSRAPPFKS